MNITIEDIEPQGIQINGKVPSGVNSQLLINGVGSGGTLIITPSLVKNEYNTKVASGSYPAELYVGTKKAAFTLSESVDLTDLINQLIEAQQ